MTWLLLLLLGLIVGFIYWMTHRPSFTMPGARLPGFRADKVPWGAQRFGVGTEALQPFEQDADSLKLFEEMLAHMGWTPSEQYFLNAVLFGLDIALTTDDYGRAGIEFENSAQVAERLAKIEFELFDNELYQQFMYFSQAILTMQDMLAQRRPPAEKEQLEQALQNYQHQMARIQRQLKMPFTGMNSSEIGTRDDRELFYLKLGITNYLRGRGLINDLDRLYRVYGVNYDVNAAFSTLEKEVPFFQKIVAQSPRELAQQGFGNLQLLLKRNTAEIELDKNNE